MRSLPYLIPLAIGLAALIWRYARLPCPSWLIPLLENPYFEFVAGADLLLNRAGVKKGMQILDAGCGPGRLTLPAAHLVGLEGEVLALDLQPKMLKELRERLTKAGLTHVRVRDGRIEAGGLPRDHIDVAFLVTVLGEIPDQEGAFAALFETLAPGGILSVTEALPDPHYQRLAHVRRLGTRAGFVEAACFNGLVSYTLNLKKDTPAG